MIVGKLVKYMSEEEKKGPQWYHLFPPSIVIKSHIDIPDGWVDKIEEWCLKYGEYVEEGRLTTTYGSTHRPHSVPWIKEILDVIAPEDAFDNSWVQVYDTGGFIPIHNHISHVKLRDSGCLFLTEGKSTYFQDPLHPNQTTSSPVKVGDVWTWDPAVYHFSPPVMDKRIILAFNLKQYE